MAQETQTGALYQPKGVGRGGRWGGMFKREGIYVYLWLIHVEVWQKTIKFCKAIILQKKKKAKKCEGRVCCWGDTWGRVWPLKEPTHHLKSSFPAVCIFTLIRRGGGLIMWVSQARLVIMQIADSWVKCVGRRDILISNQMALAERNSHSGCGLVPWCPWQRRKRMG